MDESVYIIGDDSTYGYLGDYHDLTTWKKLGYKAKSLVTHTAGITIGAVIIS